VDVWFQIITIFRLLLSFSQNCFALLLVISLSSSFVFFDFQGTSLSTMSSLLFDFAIGMGGSDFGGLIKQTLVDRENISIDGSSLEETCHSACDNESSSSERSRVLRYSGGGTSCLPLLPRLWNLSRSLWFSLILFLEEQWEVVLGMLGRLPVCNIAMVMGRHPPSPSLLDLIGWGAMFWSIGFFCKRRCFTTPSEIGEHHQVVCRSFSCTSVYLRSWV